MSRGKLGDIKLSIVDKRLQRKFIKRLLSIEKNKWVAINHTFNRWQIPPEFYDLIPKWWGYNNLPKKTFAFIRPIMEIVDNIFTKEEQLRYHNVEKGKMTDAEFTYWYSIERFEKDIMKYYEKRKYMDSIEWWKDDVFGKIKKALGETATTKE